MDETPVPQKAQRERTLFIVKPDAVMRGIVGKILARLERAGLKIVGAKLCSPSREHFHHHYETIGKLISRRGQTTFDATLELMCAGPVMAYVLEGVAAVEVVRKFVGATEPRIAAPGTIRGDYAHMSFQFARDHSLPVSNIVHASADLTEAEQEIALWFKPEEICDEYELAAARFL